MFQIRFRSRLAWQGRFHVALSCMLSDTTEQLHLNACRQQQVHSAALYGLRHLQAALCRSSHCLGPAHNMQFEALRVHEAGQVSGLWAHIFHWRCADSFPVHHVVLQGGLLG